MQPFSSFPVSLTPKESPAYLTLRKQTKPSKQNTLEHMLPLSSWSCSASHHSHIKMKNLCSKGHKPKSNSFKEKMNMALKKKKKMYIPFGTWLDGKSQCPHFSLFHKSASPMMVNGCRSYGPYVLNDCNLEKIIHISYL